MWSLLLLSLLFSSEGRAGVPRSRRCLSGDSATIGTEVVVDTKGDVNESGVGGKIFPAGLHGGNEVARGLAEDFGYPPSERAINAGHWW